MDVTRSACSFLGAPKPEHPGTHADQAAAHGVLRLGYPFWHHFQRSGLWIAFNTDPADSLATTFLKILGQDGRAADPLHVQVVNTSLILYSKLDLAAFTFSARVTASALSDTFSAICTVVGTLRGPLHGGANEASMHFLAPMRSPEHARGVLEGGFRKGYGNGRQVPDFQGRRPT